MLQRERLDDIRQIIKREKKVTVAALSQFYGVTEETIRRDLEKLMAEGLLTRTYGGAVLNAENQEERVDYTRRSMTNIEAKQKIAGLLVDYIPEFSCIAADASSTVVTAVLALSDRSNLTVLTNSIQLMAMGGQMSLKLMSCGGDANYQTLSLQGIRSRKALTDYNPDIILLGCTALDLHNGGVAYDSNEEEAEWKEILINNCEKVILLADHTKFDRRAFVNLLRFDKLDMLVTDEKPSEDWIELCEKNNVKLVYE